MTSIRRIIWTPLGRPVAGELVHTDAGPAVPIDLGPAGALYLDDPAWARDLATAAAAGASVLESERGLPAPSETPSNADLYEERDAYRNALVRLVAIERPSDLWPAIQEARIALERWGGGV